jgi:hypothetical protein
MNELAKELIALNEITMALPDKELVSDFGYWILKSEIMSLSDSTISSDLIPFQTTIVNC